MTDPGGSISARTGPAQRSADAAMPGDHPAAPPGGAAGWPVLVAIGVTAAAGFAMFVAPLPRVRPESMTGLGLISVLPVLSLVGLALVIAAFTALLGLRRPVPLMLGVLLVAVVFCLDGVTGIAEPLPRFPTTYQIYGFVNYVSHAGRVAPGVSAYFSWPGFFGLISLVRNVAGLHGLFGLLTWWPVLIDTLVLVPFLLLTRSLRMSWQARWFAALLLTVGNWVGQDYFSPQSFNFLLYVTFIAVLLTWFGLKRAPAVATAPPAAAPAGGRGRVPRLVPGERASPPVTAAQRGILLALLAGLFLASVVSHQLTPIFMVVVCAGLALVGRCTPRGLPVLFAVILAGWISYKTVGYWSGHISAIFGGLGKLGGTFSSSVGNRLVGTPAHRRAVDSRALVALVLVVLAVAGVVRRRLRGFSDRALLVLLIFPIAIAGLQSYGGEVSLRIYLFMLPALAVLAASAFFPPPRAAPAEAAAGWYASRRPAHAGTGGSQAVVPAATAARAKAAGAADDGERLRTARRLLLAPRPLVAVVLAGVVAASLGELFLLSRYGNEAFEWTPPGELAAVNYLYRHDAKTILWISRPAGLGTTPQMPWQYHKLAGVNFFSVKAPVNPAHTSAIIGVLRLAGRGAYLITASTEATFIREAASYPPAWGRDFRTALSASPGLRQVLSNRDAAVYQVRLPPSAPVARSPSYSASGSFAWTVWSPIGIVALIVAILVLAAREVIRECWPARRWLMRPLALAAAPAVVLLAIAVVERFRVIALPGPAGPSHVNVRQPEEQVR